MIHNSIAIGSNATAVSTNVVYTSGASGTNVTVSANNEDGF